MRRTNNREVCHLWANRSCAAAHGNNLFFDGDTVYSYGRHFPIARLILHPETGADCVLFTAKGYSRTTAKHKGLVLGACRRSHLPLYTVNDPLSIISSGAVLERLNCEALEDKRKAEIKRRSTILENAKRRRAEAKQAKEIVTAFPAQEVAS